MSGAENENFLKTTKGQLALKMGVGLVAGPPVGALVGGIQGSLGKYAVSFFNPAMASAAGTFGTFAGIGALAGALRVIPQVIIDYLIGNYVFLEKHPAFTLMLKSTCDLLLQVGSVTAAAAMLGTPVGPTVICMLAIPVAFNALVILVQGISAVLSAVSSAPKVVPKVAPYEYPDEDEYVPYEHAPPGGAAIRA